MLGDLDPIDLVLLLLEVLDLRFNALGNLRHDGWGGPKGRATKWETKKKRNKGVSGVSEGEQ